MAHIVVADDSPTLRRVVASLLTRAGHDVVVTEDGLEAVQAANRHQPDLVVMDVQMPRLSGYVAARLLKEDWATADIPVVLLTSLDAASDRYWGGKAGADRYLTKTFEGSELVDAVADLLEQAERGRGGAPRLRPDPVELTGEDVLDRTCDVLDRTLFEAALAGDVHALALTTAELEATIAGVLGVVGRVVDHDLAGVVLVDEQRAYLSVTNDVSSAHYREFLVRAAGTLSDATDSQFPVQALQPRVADPERRLASADAEADPAPLATFLSMPLKGTGGRVVALLALSSARSEAFGDAALGVLRLLEGPVALVVENARLREAQRAAVSAAVPLTQGLPVQPPPGYRGQLAVGSPPGVPAPGR